jgi:putative transposase
MASRNSVDSTKCRRINIAQAHVRTRSQKGALSNYKKSADEPDDHAIGRSRGGLTTKIHALTDPREAPVAIRLTAGQAGDNPQLVPLLDDYAASCKQQGMSGRDFRLLADKAYSHPSTRTELRSRRTKHTIPQRSDQIARRKAKGSTGGPRRLHQIGRHALRSQPACSTARRSNLSLPMAWATSKSLAGQLSTRNQCCWLQSDFTGCLE